MKKIKIMSVFGARPDAIKMAPLIKSIGADPAFDGVVCVTAQHREMLDQVLNVFGIKPDLDFNIMKPGQSLTYITSEVLNRVSEAIARMEKPDLVLVHGDTTTAMSAALAAFYAGVTVGHVEAGLRTRDIDSPFPEEMNRQVIGRIAKLHFAPTESNRRNLAAEGVTQNVYITGNTEIDALMSLAREDYEFRDKKVGELARGGRRIIVMTAHRRENLGKPHENVFRAVKTIAGEYPDVQFIYAVHKNPKVSEPAKLILGGIPNVYLSEPLEADDLFNLIRKSYIVMTDSGGLQESAPALGKPVLVLRTETERPEAVEMGTVKMAGVEYENVVRETKRLLDDGAAYQAMSKAVNPYGDGTASAKIIAAVKQYFGSGKE